jgi:hypothetical protein
MWAREKVQKMMVWRHSLNLQILMMMEKRQRKRERKRRKTALQPLDFRPGYELEGQVDMIVIWHMRRRNRQVGRVGSVGQFKMTKQHRGRKRARSPEHMQIRKRINISNHCPISWHLSWLVGPALWDHEIKADE